MTTRHLAALIVAGLATSAAARPQVALDVFLEQRVAEELAADGTNLSRMGVALDIELVGDKTLVSLVDPATRRAIASTKLDTLPADREAAVATVTQVVANLTSQLATTSSALKTALEEERLQRERKDAAKDAYAREAIRFGDVPIVESDGEAVRTTISSLPYIGDRRLDAPEFYEIVGRTDLKEAYEARRRAGLAAGIVGVGIALGGGVLGYMNGFPDTELGTCDINAPGFSQCVAAKNERNDQARQDAKKWVVVSFGVMTAGTIISLVGVYYYRHPNPIGDREAHDIADQHNAKLRTKHGLPAVSVSPYADEHGGGLAVAGRF